MKLVAKRRDGAKVTKTYDTARTPYQRLLDSDYVPQEAEDQVTQRHRALNPAALQRRIMQLRRQLKTLAADYEPELAKAIHDLSTLYGITPDDGQDRHPPALAEHTHDRQ